MDLSRLSPADAAVTLRGLERRYRALFAGLDEDESPDDLAHRHVAGWSAAEHVVAATERIAAGHRALRAVLVEDQPRLAASDVGVDAPPHPAVVAGLLDTLLAELGREAAALADRIVSTPSADWERTGAVADDAGRAVTALDVVRAAVDAAISHLREAGKTLDAARIAQ
jgi:hypothetical protein